MNFELNYITWQYAVFQAMFACPEVILDRGVFQRHLVLMLLSDTVH